MNLSRREADLAIAVSPPKTDRLSAERLADYRLSLAASRDYLARVGAPTSRADLKGARMIGYIPDMIFDAELDYLAGLGVTRVPLASNAVSVQLNYARAGAGLAIVHDFALPFAPDLCRVLAHEIRLRRTFWLVSHAGAARRAPRPVRGAFAGRAARRAYSSGGGRFVTSFSRVPRAGASGSLSERSHARQKAQNTGVSMAAYVSRLNPHHRSVTGPI